MAWRWHASLWLCSPPKPAKMGGASGYISFAAASPISSLQRQRPFFVDSSLTPRSAVEAPQKLDWTSCSDQLADSAIPCGYPVRSRRANASAALLQMPCHHCKTCGNHLHTDDTHAECVSHLGKSHADAALSGAECSHCNCFSLASLRSRLAFFSEIDSAPSTLPFSSSQGSVRKKNSGQRIWAAGDKRAHVGSMPVCLAITAKGESIRPSSSLNIISPPLRCERHDLVWCEWRRNRWLMPVYQPWPIGETSSS